MLAIPPLELHVLPRGVVRALVAQPVEFEGLLAVGKIVE